MILRFYKTWVVICCSGRSCKLDRLSCLLILDAFNHYRCSTVFWISISNGFSRSLKAFYVLYVVRTNSSSQKWWPIAWRDRPLASSPWKNWKNCWRTRVWGRTWLEKWETITTNRFPKTSWKTRWVPNISLLLNLMFISRCQPLKGYYLLLKRCLKFGGVSDVTWCWSVITRSAAKSNYKLDIRQRISAQTFIWLIASSKSLQQFLCCRSESFVLNSCDSEPLPPLGFLRFKEREL